MRGTVFTLVLTLAIVGTRVSLSEGTPETSNTQEVNGAGASFQTAAYELPTEPPGGELKSRAVALEDGILYMGEDEELEVGSFTAGTVFIYYGEVVDTFGRIWSVVGDPNVAERVEGSYAAPFGDRTFASYGNRAAFLAVSPPLRTSDEVALPTESQAMTVYDLPGEAIDATIDDGLDDAKQVMSSSSEQGDPGAEENQVQGETTGQTETLESGESIATSVEEPETMDYDGPLPTDDLVTRLRFLGPEHMLFFEEAIAIDAFYVPLEVLSEGLDLLRGSASQVAWPDDPVPGQLYIPLALRLLFRWSGSEWEPLDPPRTLDPSFSLLSNSLLAVSTSPRRPPRGSGVPCWSLVGAFNPLGEEVGTLSIAPPPPLPILNSTWRVHRLLGKRDMSSVFTPLAPKDVEVPQKLEVPSATGGIQIADSSRRQAVYIEQQLPAVMTRKLRGRAMRLTVYGRSASADSTATVGLSVRSGTDFFSASGVVNSEPTPITLLFVVPDDAVEIRVRLLPKEVTLAVQEAGAVIIDRAALTLDSWPVELDTQPVLLPRVRAVYYRPSMRFTRAPLVITDRHADELRRAWPQLAAGQTEELVMTSVFEGKLRSGMNSRLVELAWGNPTERSSSGTGARLDVWRWSNRTATFRDGVLVAWSKRLEPPEPEPPWCSAWHNS